MGTPASLLWQKDIPDLNDREMEFLRKLIYEKAGIMVSDSRRDLINTRLQRRLRHHGFKTWRPYLDLLKSGDHEELVHFINQLTTNKTEFFREVAHFDYLKATYLKSLPQKETPYFFWIGACSSGQEVITLMMILEEHRDLHPSFDYRILGTDIDTKILLKAKNAIYEKKLVTEQVPLAYRSRFFENGTGPNQGFCRVIPKYLEKIKYRQFNLTVPHFDLKLRFQCIFLRNVLIYFDPQTIHRILENASLNLARDGILILGHCESLVEAHPSLEGIKSSIYRRRT